MSTNFAKTLVWKHGNDVKLWRHKQRTPNANDHHVTLNQNHPNENFLRTSLASAFNYELWGELTLSGVKCACNDLAELTPCKLRRSLDCSPSISYSNCKRANGGLISTNPFVVSKSRSKVNSDLSLDKDSKTQQKQTKSILPAQVNWVNKLLNQLAERATNN